MKTSTSPTTPAKRGNPCPRFGRRPANPTAVFELRERLGLTQSEVAKFLGVSPRSVRKYEHGETPVKGSIARLYFILGRETRDLLPPA